MSTVALKPSCSDDVACLPRSVSVTPTLAAVPAGTTKSDPARRPPAPAPSVGPLEQRLLGRQMRNAPWHTAERLHLSFTVATPLAAVAPPLSRVTQCCSGQCRHPIAAHGYPGGLSPAELPAC